MKGDASLAGDALKQPPSIESSSYTHQKEVSHTEMYWALNDTRRKSNNGQRSDYAAACIEKNLKDANSLFGIDKSSDVKQL